MNIREVIEDHALAKRLYLRQAGGDQYWGICPWCGMAGALMLDPVHNHARCTQRKCVARKYMTAQELDYRLRS